MKGERDKRGRFIAGNRGGPGRPPLVIEADYLVALSDAVAIEDWIAIVDSAVAGAKDGDHKARDWLSKYLLGVDPPTLIELAIRTNLGLTSEAEVEAEAEHRLKSPNERNLDLISGRTILRRAIELADSTDPEEDL